MHVWVYIVSEIPSSPWLRQMSLDCETKSPKGAPLPQIFSRHSDVTAARPVSLTSWSGKIIKMPPVSVCLSSLHQDRLSYHLKTPERTACVSFQGFFFFLLHFYIYFMTRNVINLRMLWSVASQRGLIWRSSKKIRLWTVIHRNVEGLYTLAGGRETAWQHTFKMPDIWTARKINRLYSERANLKKEKNIISDDW